MSESSLDLSGAWLGRYDYSKGLGNPVPFEAELTQDGHLVAGRTVEPNTFAARAGSELTAMVDGEATGYDVSFTKTYDRLSQPDNPRYTGTVTASGNRIEGTWTFPSWPWINGNFSMFRKPRASAHTTESSDARVDA